jgi:stage II sporulation protein D
VSIRKFPAGQTIAPGRLGRSYRGAIEIQRIGDNALRIVSILPLEEYLCGVVPSETVRPLPEALKAQAVAARTYALAQMEKSARNGAEFDVYSDIGDQCFSGRTHATPRPIGRFPDPRHGAYYRDRLITPIIIRTAAAYRRRQQSGARARRFPT